jgi:hypothetical protein
MSAGKAEIFPQQLHQQCARIDIGCDRLAVNGQGYGRHKRLLDISINTMLCIKADSARSN